MGTKKKHIDESLPEPKRGEPISGTRKNDAKAAFQLILSTFKARAQGLDGPGLDKEIDRLMEQLIEKNARLAPEPLRPELRKVLRGQLEHDPTLSELLADLRRNVSRS